MAVYNALDTVTLTALAKTLYRSKLLQRVFFGARGENEFDTEMIEVHLKKHVRTVAPYVSRTAKSKIYSPDETSVSVIKPPFIAERVQIDEERLKQRQFGQSIFSSMSRDQQMAETVSQWVEELVARTERAVERQCSDVLKTGKLSLEDGTSIDYGRDDAATVTLTGNALWDNSASDPIATLESERKKIANRSGISPNMIVMGTEAWQSFRKNENVSSFFDAVKADFGMIKDERMGVVESMHIHIPGIGTVYTYDGTYDTADETSTDFVPSKGVFYGPPMAGGIFYGAIQSKETGRLEKSTMILDQYIENDPVASYLRCRSAPVAVPINLNAYSFITVLS